jgi:hypothetical protein
MARRKLSSPSSSVEALQAAVDPSVMPGSPVVTGDDTILSPMQPDAAGAPLPMTGMGMGSTDMPYHQTQEAREIVNIIKECMRESELARKGRIQKNRANMDVYMGIQDYSEKIEGQSCEFLPKVAIAAEQMCAFIKRGLVQFGDWFSIDMDERITSQLAWEPEHFRKIINNLLDHLQLDGDKTISFPVVISDAVKAASLESLLVLKVHGGVCKSHKFFVEPGERLVHLGTGQTLHGPDTLGKDDRIYWRGRIDVVRFEDYYPDPSGRNLYEIHFVERDYYQVLESAEAGMYDLAAVKSLQHYEYPVDDERYERARGGKDYTSPQFRKRVVLAEFWGTLLDKDGSPIARNCVATVANNDTLIRKPEDNPFWHGESPFVAQPLVRVPHSVFHKAIYDHGSDLNIALNELFNLMLDGGLASVWGTRQVHTSWLEDPSQVDGGIPQGATLAVNEQCPIGGKAVETVTTGNVPQDAMLMFEAISREFASAVCSNELKMGTMPPAQTRATTVVQQSQDQAVTLDGIISDLEEGVMEPAIRKFWLTCLQNLDAMDPSEIISSAPAHVSIPLLKMTPVQRFVLFAKACSFKVTGLSGTMNRARDFQKAMSLFQMLPTNPMLAQAFFKEFSPDKALKSIMKQLNINPDDLKRSPAEKADMQQDMQDMAMFAHMSAGGNLGEDGGGAAAGPGITQSGMGGGTNMQGSQPAISPEQSSLTSELAQAGNPTGDAGIPA